MLLNRQLCWHDLEFLQHQGCAEDPIHQLLKIDLAKSVANLTDGLYIFNNNSVMVTN